MTVPPHASRPGPAVGRSPLESMLLADRKPGYAGTNLMALAAANGFVHVATGDDGSPRGVFCGMGVCGECTVTLPDGSRARACMTPCPGAGPMTLPEIGPDEVETPDLLVVGAGPAGLAAARAAALHGLDVVLLDERDKPGGQYFKQRSPVARGGVHDDQMAAGARLIDKVRALGVRILQNAVVWGAFRPLEFAVLQGGTSRPFRPRRAILATGAYERGVPLPGWTLPGVMTTGAAQTLLRAHGTAPGQRVLIAGNGPLNFQLAFELLRVGVEVVAVAEAAPAPSLASLRSLPGLVSAPRLLAQGIRFLASMRRAGTALHYRTVLSGVDGQGRAQRARLAGIDPSGSPTDTATYDVDLVCVGYGLEPANELARLLGCELRYDEDRGTFATVTDEDGATSVPGLLVAGDGGGRVGAHAALAQGWLAGCRAARDLDRTVPRAVLVETRRQRAGLARHRRFQSSLWDLFRAPVLRHQLASADTAICRCENVTLARIQAELDAGIDSIGALKRGTRAGMGRCQGRYCGPVLVGLLANRSGTLPSDTLAFAPRPPVRPVPLAAIAARGDT